MTLVDFSNLQLGLVPFEPLADCRPFATRFSIVACRLRFFFSISLLMATCGHYVCVCVITRVDQQDVLAPA